LNRALAAAAAAREVTGRRAAEGEVDADPVAASLSLSTAKQLDAVVKQNTKLATVSRIQTKYKSLISTTKVVPEVEFYKLLYLEFKKKYKVTNFFFEMKKLRRSSGSYLGK